MDTGALRWLRGDETRLRQALLNYAGNAVMFTQSGAIALRAVAVFTARRSAASSDMPSGREQ